MRTRSDLRSVFVFLVVATLATSVHAVWFPNGKSMVDEANDQSIGATVPDGSGGAIVVWEDKRFGVLSDIYAQRTDADGETRWLKNGLPVCGQADNQLNPAAVPDGGGGAIVVWEDYRSGGDIYAQRIDPFGNPLWSFDGIPVCQAANIQVSPQVIPYGGGAIVVWFDRRSGDFDIYAQRLDSTGDTLWTGDGVAVSTIAGSDQRRSRLASGSSGNVIITWEDRRGGFSSDIYAQCLDEFGASQWLLDGSPVCTDTLSQLIPHVVPDGAGGAVIAWEDGRTGDSDIYAQRLDAAGAPVWTLNGEIVCDETDSQLEPILVSDGAGGGIVVWSDYRDFLNSPDIYAQRIDAAGVTQWTPNGEGVCTAPDAQYLGDVVPDGAGGAYLSWSDSRTGDSNIYAQRLNSAGLYQWTADGAVLCNSAGYQSEPLITADGSGCAIVAWTDPRSGDNNVYAISTPGCTTSGVDNGGRAPRAQVRLYQNFPNPFSGATRFEFELPFSADADIEVFDARGRRIHVEHLHGLAAGIHSVEFHRGMTRGGSIPAGVYHYRLTVAGSSQARKMVILK